MHDWYKAVAAADDDSVRDNTFPTRQNILALYDGDVELVDIVRSTPGFSVVQRLQSSHCQVTLDVTECFASLLQPKQRLLT